MAKKEGLYFRCVNGGCAVHLWSQQPTGWRCFQPEPDSLLVSGEEVWLGGERYLTAASCVPVRCGVGDATCYLKPLCLHPSPANKLFSASLPHERMAAASAAVADHLPA